MFKKKCRLLWTDEIGDPTKPTTDRYYHEFYHHDLKGMEYAKLDDLPISVDHDELKMRCFV